ncbi:MAG: AAA family ATPase [Bacteroidales bacterium]|jgi:predicted AAA+ superfamily ATPase|nr:AAA family ATPase [Bacteroidales bacterium]
MEKLTEKFYKKLSAVSLTFIRSAMNQINWNARLIGIKGARGVGKTTLLLQYIKINFELDPSVLYVSLDDIWFSENKISDLADRFVKQGGRMLFLDEVHKYPGWSREIKNIYDDYPELKIVFTGSSLLEIINAGADLSRRAIIYKMQGLSFREYLNLECNLNLNIIELKEILDDHLRLSKEIVSVVKPLKHFQDYLTHGYYPYYREISELYHMRLAEVINMILEIELPLLRGVDPLHVNRLKQMLLIITESAPFIPNISKLSERTGINRNTFIIYLNYLYEADILKNLYRDARGITRLQKPEKIYLENSNIAFAIRSLQPDKGSIRETFFANQLSFGHTITFPDQGDFLVNDSLLFEVGGRNKATGQIRNHSGSYIASDDIEFGHKNTIPLWLFGFIY